MKFLYKKKAIIIDFVLMAFTVLALAFLILFAAMDQDLSHEPKAAGEALNKKELVNKDVIDVSLPPTLELPKKTVPPEFVKGIYLTAYSANREEWRGRLIEKMKNGRINSVVIDIKDYTGYVLYDSELEIINELKTKKPLMKDVKKIIQEFKDAGIYTIARQTVFQDPALVRAKPAYAIKTKWGSIWLDKSGLAWADPRKVEVWDYNVNIAKEAAEIGFDEINFDYMRYPSDGNTRAMELNIPAEESKADMMGNFFKYLSEELSDIVNISIDMFGLVLDNADRDYDLGIGQTLSSTVDYFDFVSPMTYPSHYYSGYLGLNNPAAFPGTVVGYGIKKGGPFFEENRATLRPWLQAFNMGAIYNERMIDLQTDAVESATSTTGWLLWNARNYYPDYIFKNDHEE